MLIYLEVNIVNPYLTALHVHLLTKIFRLDAQICLSQIVNSLVAVNNLQIATVVICEQLLDLRIDMGDLQSNTFLTLHVIYKRFDAINDAELTEPT